VFLSTIVEAFVSNLFAGMSVRGCYQFRVTRNSDLFVEQEEVDDLLRAVEGELASRRYGDAVRLETAHHCPEEILSFLLDEFALTPNDLYRVAGPVNLSRLMAVYDLVDIAALKYPSFAPSVPERLRMGSDLFAALRDGDVLLHHPFQGFGPVIDFIKQAAADPAVLAIKQTLYRAGSDSTIVGALAEAAQAGKDVTVIIELRARFDEETNIDIATKLQEAGAHVMYGVFGFKTHAKAVMVVRREASGLRRYCHLGTGNYHMKTARLYTDYGLLTADEAIGSDIHEMFLQLTGLTRVPRLRKLLHAPFSLHRAIVAKIERETEHAHAGKPARIIAKLNALTEPAVIQALYAASRAGVEIDLIVRGVCCLRPGISGVSDRIRVRSIVGRFLEHSRVYSFANDGKPEIYCGSADWMDRNLFRRVEVAFPVESPELQARVADELQLYLDDDVQAWSLLATGKYVRVPGTTHTCAQTRLLARYDERVALTDN
jgi:polyphosphate kinase